MSKKDRVVITRTEEFSEIESELATAMETLEDTNSRIEALLQAHAKSDSETDEIVEPVEGSEAATETA